MLTIPGQGDEQIFQLSEKKTFTHDVGNDLLLFNVSRLSMRCQSKNGLIGLCQ